MNKKIKLQVKGMACMGCVATVTQKLKGLEGVSEVRVSLQPPEAFISFDDSRTAVDKIIAAARAAGYPASLEQDTGGEKS